MLSWLKKTLLGDASSDAAPTAPPTREPSGLNTRPDGSTLHLALYKYDSCPFCWRVQRAIDRLDVAVELRDTRKDPTRRAELKHITGRRTVPCLFIDGEPMFESADIIAWLEARFPIREAT